MATTHPNSLFAQASRIVNEFSGGQRTDDTRFSVRSVMRFIVEGYSELLYQYLNSGRANPPDAQFFRPLCIQLTQVSPSDCGCPDLTCRILKGKLPKMMNKGDTPMIGYVGTDDRSERYRLSTWNQIASPPKGRFTPVSNKTRYVVEEGSIYVIPTPDNLACTVTVVGIPTSLTSTTKGCFNIWADSKIPEYLMSRVREQVVGGPMRITASTPIDLLNNSAPQ